MIDVSDFILQVANSTAPATVGVVEQVADQTNNALIAGLTTTAGVITTIGAKLFKDNRNTQNQIKATDEDLAEYIDLLDLEDKYTIENPTKTRAEILNMPAYPEDSRITTKLYEAKAKEAKEWREYREELKRKK